MKLTAVNIDGWNIFKKLHIESIAFQFNNKFLKLIQNEFSHSEIKITFLFDEKWKFEKQK